MTALDNALTAINASIGDTTDERVLLIAAKCRGLMRGYDARWASVPWETLSVEEEYSLPLMNPQTGKRSRTFTTAGKYDGIIRYSESGKTYLLEHKTASDDISDPSSPYWMRLAIDSQVSHYVLSQWQRGIRLDGTVYDVIRKPGIRPRILKPAEQKALVTWGTYFGVNVGKQEATSETFQLYEVRLAHECTEDPHRYFQRRTIPRLDNELLEYAREAWDVGQSIIHARANDAHYRNSGACVQYNSPCEYLGLCSGNDTIENTDRWERTTETHSELEVDGSHLNILTNSRIKCFQLCRRKHQLRYELGVRRRDEEEREALFYGSLMHLALGAWWNFFKTKGDEHYVDSDSAAVGVAQSADSNSGEELGFPNNE